MHKDDCRKQRFLKENPFPRRKTRQFRPGLFILVLNLSVPAKKGTEGSKNTKESFPGSAVFKDFNGMKSPLGELGAVGPKAFEGYWHGDSVD